MDVAILLHRWHYAFGGPPALLSAASSSTETVVAERDALLQDITGTFHMGDKAGAMLVVKIVNLTAVLR